MPVEDDEWVEEPAGAVATTSSASPLESSVAPPDREAHRVDDVETNAASDETPKEFDPRWRKPLEGLLFLGALRDTFTWLGHTFQIRTLNTAEHLEVALLHAKYAPTIGDAKAYQTLLVSACLDRVDGQPVSVPLTSDGESLVEDRFRVVSRYFPPVIDHIYDRYSVLETVAEKVLAEMGEA